jgi:hypothetical protein
MSHATRIDETGAKPWHMSVTFQLFDQQSRPLERGTLEEWWAAPGLWKITIDSPSYKSTTIENHDGDFRTAGVGPIPLTIRAIERNLVYPAPMGEDLSRTIPHVSHEKLEGARVDCIELGEPTTVVQFPSYCLDSADDGLKEIRTDRPWSMIRNRITSFQGRSVALSIATREGKRNTTAAEVSGLIELPMSDGLFSPSPEMKRTGSSGNLLFDDAKGIQFPRAVSKFRTIDNLAPAGGAT